MDKPFVDLICSYPPLPVGRPAERFAALLQAKLGVTVPGAVPINSSEELDSCIEAMLRIPHAWSLVSAGGNAVIMFSVMASECGKVSLDFGHAPDNVMGPDYPDYWLNTD